MEVNKVRKALINNKGSGFPLTVAIALCLVIIFTGISEYFRLMIVAQGVRDTLQAAVISIVNDNYDDVYHGIREGYSGGYQPISSEFEESVDYGDVYDQMDRILGLEQNGECHVKLTSDAKTEFQISDLEIEVQNAPLAGGDITGRRFEIDSSILLEVPVSFGGRALPSIKIRVKNSAGYTPKF